MEKTRLELVRGTLDVLILKSLVMETARSTGKLQRNAISMHPTILTMGGG